ncbi:MAG: GMC oxidoreductase [Planctomycetota bacterium]|jgi:choline dehydrogenase-like flavoprotein
MRSIRRVQAVVADPVEGGETVRIETGRLVLAAGALCSTKIVLDSIYHRTGRVERATGLMDNRQIHVPFMSFPLLGSEAETSAYQFHHLAFGLDRDDPADYVHGQITTLKSASIHPIVQSLPFDLRTAVSAFRHIRAGLAVANVNLPDRRREQSHATIRPLSGSERTEMVLNYVSDTGEESEMARAVGDVKRVLRRLGCFTPPGMTRVLPKGNSAHYAGTLPMSATSMPLGTAPDGASWDFPNLYVVDGAALPFLPAVNHTFTLMANAVRVAEVTLA